MASHSKPFEFNANLSHLDEGLDTLHESIKRLREATGRGEDDRNLMHFEIALAEIGANVLTHGRPAGTDPPVEYRLWLEDDAAHALFVDGGPAVEEVLSRAMPDPTRTPRTPSLSTVAHPSTRFSLAPCQTQPARRAADSRWPAGCSMSSCTSAMESTTDGGW